MPATGHPLSLLRAFAAGTFLLAAIVLQAVAAESVSSTSAKAWTFTQQYQFPQAQQAFARELKRGATTENREIRLGAAVAMLNHPALKSKEPHSKNFSYCGIVAGRAPIMSAFGRVIHLDAGVSTTIHLPILIKPTAGLNASHPLGIATMSLNWLVSNPPDYGCMLPCNQIPVLRSEYQRPRP